MIKNKNILSAILLLGLTLSTLNGVDASGNSLVQMDLAKTSGDSLNVTLYTSGSSSEAPVVSKKSDNKYVILMPNVSGNQSSKPDLSALKDLVSDIDIKSVNDGAEGYTKVTVITKKPVNIKTSMQSSGPVTQEQTEYRQLIAKARANSIKTSRIPTNEVPVSLQKKTETPKTTVTVNKVQPKAESKSSAPKIKFKEVNPSDLVAKNTPAATKKIPVKLEPVEIKEKPAAKISEKLPPPTQSIKKEMDAQANKADKAEKTVKPPKDDLLIPVNVSEKNGDIYSKVKDKAKRHLPAGFPVGLTIILIPIIGLLMLIKMIRNSIQKSNILKQSFMDNLKNHPEAPKSYDDIIENEDLSWQEKYNKYLNKTAAPEENTVKKQSRYKFISLPQDDVVEEKREELERTMSAPAAKRPMKPKAITTSVERLEKLDDTPPPMKEVETPKKFIKSEDSKIHEEISKTVKLKAFAKAVSLEETSRRRSLNKKAAALLDDEVVETETVPLRESKLSANMRKLSDANLKISEVSEKSIDDIRAEQFKAEQDYVVTSVDEYLTVLEEDAVTSKVEEPIRMTTPIAKAEKTSVAASLAQMKPSMKYQKPQINKSDELSNPITSSRNTSKKSYLDGLIVKSGFNIDEEKGFYVVNVDGTSALVGRVKDEVFVLKKFDNNVEKPLQVRRDQQNVFMVKADGYRSLVKVDEEKMGVLVEM